MAQTLLELDWIGMLFKSSVFLPILGSIFLPDWSV
jgi:hypothetical protein